MVQEKGEAPCDRRGRNRDDQLNMSAPLSKLAHPLAPLMGCLELGAEAAAPWPGLKAPHRALRCSRRLAFRTEAVRLCAHALPRREAVWWACMCARGVPPQALPAADIAALNAAETWVRKPGDEALRRAAWDAAQATDFRSPEAWAAVGAFWSGGSLSPEGQPVTAGRASDGRCRVRLGGASLGSWQTRARRGSAHTLPRLRAGHCRRWHGPHPGGGELRCLGRLPLASPTCTFVRWRRPAFRLFRMSEAQSYQAR